MPIKLQLMLMMTVSLIQSIKQSQYKVGASASKREREGKSQWVYIGAMQIYLFITIFFSICH